jgi:glucokinase
LILAGDVGGTKTNLALFEVAAGGQRPLRAASFPSADYPGFGPILTEFLGGEAGVEAACFGIPGPVLDNRAATTNLPWELDGEELARSLGIPRLALVNDLFATAYGIPWLQPDELAVLHAGEAEPDGAVALIAAGTGLGMSLIPPGGGLPLPSEGGHQDFAPRSEEEVEVWRRLRARFGRVSVERVVSGPGLLSVYEALREAGDGGESPEVRAALAAPEADAVPIIAEAALAGSCPLCARALDLWAAAYGAAAGNLALVGLATGGVFAGGGMAPKLLAKLRDGGFVAAFRDKGRFQPLMERIPIRVILNEGTAVLGAARWAAGLIGEAPGA